MGGKKQAAPVPSKAVVHAARSRLDGSKEHGDSGRHDLVIFYVQKEKNNEKVSKPVVFVSILVLGSVAKLINEYSIRSHCFQRA